MKVEWTPAVDPMMISFMDAGIDVPRQILVCVGGARPGIGRSVVISMIAPFTKVN
jgi:hypothetical protein